MGINNHTQVTNLRTERSFRRVGRGYACYHVARQPQGLVFFKAGVILNTPTEIKIQDAWNWINGDDRVELIATKLGG